MTSPKTLECLVPTVQNIRNKEEFASLSLERICFGHVPVGTTLRRILVVKNESKDIDLIFKWIIPLPWDPTNLTVTPSSGKLQAGKSQVCKIVFRPGFEPRYYDFDIICEIENSTEKLIYHAKIEAAKLIRNENRPLSGMTAEAAEEPLKTKKSDIQKYKTLPPINQASKVVANKGI